MTEHGSFFENRARTLLNALEAYAELTGRGPEWIAETLRLQDESELMSAADFLLQTGLPQRHARFIQSVVRSPERERAAVFMTAAERLAEG